MITFFIVEGGVEVVIWLRNTHCACLFLLGRHHVESDDVHGLNDFVLGWLLCRLRKLPTFHRGTAFGERGVASHARLRFQNAHIPTRPVAVVWILRRGVVFLQPGDRLCVQMVRSLC